MGSAFRQDSEMGTWEKGAGRRSYGKSPAGFSSGHSLRGTRRPAWLFPVFTLLALLTLLVAPSSGAVPDLPMTPHPGRLPNAPYPGVYTFDDFTNVDPRNSAVVGGHRNFNWKDLNPAPNLYDWTVLDEWIADQVALGKRVGFAVNAYKGADSGGDVTPPWVYELYPNARIFCYDEFSVPKYWDPDWQEAYRTFLQALAERYDGDPRVAFIEISVGVYGEARPVEGGLNDCLKSKGLTSELWVQTVEQIIQMYVDLFPRTALLFQMGRFLNWWERREMSDFAAQRGVGLKWNLLLADTGNAVFTESEGCARDNSCGAGWADLMWKWWEQVAIGFEGYDYYFDDASGHLLWGIYNALDKHADYLLLNTGITTDPNEQEYLAFANEHLGRTAADTPSAWVALRDSDPDNPRIGSSLLRQHSNFSYFLYQDDSVPGGRTVPEFNVGNDPRGRFTRRTDRASGNSCMYFKVDDAYFYNGPPGVTINVTYYDNGWDRWQLQYDAMGNAYKSAGVVQKRNSGQWKTVTFDLPDALLANREVGGSDFRICTWDSGDEYIHFVQVIRNPAAIPTPTNTPVPPPTPTPAPPTPTLTPTPPVTVITLQQGRSGYNRGADTYIAQNAPSSNFGGDQVLAVDTRGSRRALLRFDNLPTPPPGSTLVKAELSLYYLKRDPYWATGWLRAYEVYKPWHEDQATWYQARNGLPWTKAGADDTRYDRAPHLTDDVWIAGTDQWYTLDITPLVRGWLADPASNQGLLLKGWVLGNKYLYMEFASGQYPDPRLRPKLTLYFWGPTPTPTPCPGGVCPTNTPTPPSVEPSATPGVTPTPTLTPTPSPTPTSTPTPTFTPTPTTVVFQEGTDPGNGLPFVGTSDTYIDRWQGTNFGGDIALRVRRDVRKSLIRFDVSRIPRHATVWHAELQLWVINRSNADPIDVAVYRLLRPWEEAGATWARASTAQPWQEPGASGSLDRAASPAATITVNVGGGWVSWDVTDLVQAWVRDPDVNYGLLLEAVAGGTGNYAFYSSDSPDIARRPKLIVTYAADPVAPPEGGTATPTPTFTPTPTPEPTSTPVTGATQVILQKGNIAFETPYRGSTDAYISKWQPTQNFGLEPTLLIRSGDVRHVLLRFPLEGFPPNTHIVRATLGLYFTYRTGPIPLTLQVYRLLRPWEETAVTWQRAGGSDWQEAGAAGSADRESVPVATAVLDPDPGWVEIDVTDAARAWLAYPERNFGLLLRGEAAGGVQYTFLSNEWADAARRPQLIVEYVVYTPTPTPTPTWTPTPTPTPSPTPTPTPTFTPTATWTPSPTPTPTWTSTPTLPPGTPTPPWPTPTPGPKRLDVPPVLTPVVVDGSLAEWNVAPHSYLSASNADTVRGTPSTASDLTGWLWSAWDSEYLYFAVHVVDDVVVGGDSTDVWRDDGVEIAVDGSPDGETGPDHHQFTLVSDGRLTDFGGVRDVPTGVVHAVWQVPGGYIAEIAIPWSALGITTPAPGTRINFTWGLNDDDNGGDRDSYLVWAGSSTYFANQGMAPLTLMAGPLTPTPTPSPTPTVTPTSQVLETVFQEGVGGYTGVRDTTLSRWFPTTPLGGDATITVRTLDEAHALLRFENLNLPSNAQVLEAMLELYLVRQAVDGTVTLAAYPLQRAWVEREATWQEAAAGVVWGEPGAAAVPTDRGGTPVAEVQVGQHSGWVRLDITSLVSRWLAAPSSNFGLLLRAEGQSPIELVFVSREWLGVQVRPRLRIRYTRP